MEHKSELTCGACITRTNRAEQDIEKLEESMVEIRSTLSLILQQTTKHNGRMESLEKDMIRNFSNDEKVHNKVSQIESTVLKAYAYVAGISSTVGVVGAVIGKLL